MSAHFYRLFIVFSTVAIFVLLLNNNAISMYISGKIYNLEVKRINSKILESVKKYNICESAYTNVYYTEADDDYINLILQTIDIYYPLILNDFCLEDYPKVTVVIYPTVEKMYTALGLDIKAISMGIYYGGILNLLSPALWIKDDFEPDIKDKFLKTGPIIHELTHLVLDNKTNGNYPIWFTEGVALFYEFKYTGFEWRNDLSEKSKHIKLNDLENMFRFLDESLAYRRCFDIIDYLVVKQGEVKLQKLITLMSFGQSFEKAFNNVYNCSVEIIDNF